MNVWEMYEALVIKYSGTKLGRLSALKIWQAEPDRSDHSDPRSILIRYHETIITHIESGSFYAYPRADGCQKPGGIQQR